MVLGFIDLLKKLAPKRQDFRFQKHEEQSKFFEEHSKFFSKGLDK